MKALIKCSPWIAGMLAGLAFSAFAAEFVPPAEGPVAFRRDKIPLDAEAMAGLSRQLDNLAHGFKPQNAAERRGAAQMLALSMALDPANTKAREMLGEYVSNNHKADADRDLVERSRARVWQTIGWLDTPEAGAQAHALAACLKDVMAIDDPKNPKAEAIRQAGEKGAWDGWVPPVAAYEKKASVASHDNEKPNQADTPTEVQVSSTARNNSPKLRKAEVSTVLWSRVGSDEPPVWALACSPLRMSARQVDKGAQGENDFTLSIGTNEGWGPYSQLADKIRQLLKASHGELPTGVWVSVTSRHLDSSIDPNMRQSFSAAAAVLASAAITGREPDAIVLGKVSETGEFSLPAGFWNQLQALGKGSGQRLVLPVDAMPYLASILALERPGFFLEYEVLLATDFKQLLEMTSKPPQGAFAATIGKFQEIREKSGTQDVRQYIANSFVRQRLMAVYQECPSHVSARMLLIQAAGNRPTTVTRQVLAAELRRALEPMAASARNSESFGAGDVGKLTRIYENCRPRVDALERYAEKKDRDLIERSRATVVALRTLERSLRPRGEGFTGGEPSYAARSELTRSFRELDTTLATEMGEGQAKVER